MNKDLLNTLPSDDQPVASKLTSISEDMQLSQSFQWELEAKLMDAAKNKKETTRGWQAKIFPALAWTAAVIGGLLILNWTVRSLSSPAPAAVDTPEPVPSFQENVRQGSICTGPLTVGHGFAVFLTNQAKTAFIPVDPAKNIGEMRSFTWSPDGKKLAIVGNTTGQGNIHILNPNGGEIEYLLTKSPLGYLMDAAWSRDGNQFVMWSSQNNKVIYLLNANGTGLIEKQLAIQVLGTPQFAPDGKSVVYFGADENTAGLFEVNLDSLQTSLITPSVKDPGGYAFSPDGTHLAYVEYLPDAGEAQLVMEELATGKKSILGKMPISKNPGAALPYAANLNWSATAKFLVFDYGLFSSERPIYLAPIDGTGLVKVVDSGYAPALSSDGKCLAYINDNGVYLLDTSNLSSTVRTTTPLLIAELPAGRGSPNAKQDKLQWRP